MTANQNFSFRPDIQGLRAIAITLVVLGHADVSLFSGGFVGVDVFFVLSGYLISDLLLREYRTSGRIQLAAFYSRRLKRLLPALAVMLTLVILTAPLLLSRHEILAQLSSAPYAATWTSNLAFAFSRIDYFAELKTHDLFLHTWSLGLEEQFYLVWPLLILFALRLATRQTGRGSARHALPGLLALLAALSLGVLWFWTTTHPMWAFYLMPSRIWQFAIGASVLVWLDPAKEIADDASCRAVSTRWSAGLGWAGVALIIGSAIAFYPGMTYPGYFALLPSLGAAFIIAAGHGRTPAGLGKLLAHPTLTWVGDHSYSWYLWHWPVLMLGLAWGVQTRVGGTAGLVLLSLLLAVLSYRGIERPFWKGRLSHAAPPRIILLSLLAMLAVIALSVNDLKLLRRDDESNPRSPSTAARLDVPAIYAAGCDAWYENADVRPCVIGEPGAHKTVVLLGDSIGAQWFSLLPGIFRAPEWRIIVLTKSSCAMVDVDYFYTRIGQMYTVCTAWRNAVLDYLQSVRPEVLFVGSAATYDFSESQWIEGSTRVLARLSAAAGQVFVVPGTPALTFDGPSCLERSTQAPVTAQPPAASHCLELLTNGRAATVADYLERAVGPFPNASLLDLNDLVCPAGSCAAQRPDGLVVFRDNQHLTDSFVRAQIPVVAKRIGRE